MRFRVEIEQMKSGWIATVYDLEDHGPDLPYAQIFGDLASVLNEAKHYVEMAA